MKPLVVRGLEIGSGVPKTVVPVMPRVQADIAGLAASACANGADMLEWRADYLDSSKPDTFAACARDLRQAAGRTPVMFTMRSLSQGGECALASDIVVSVVDAVVSTGEVDLIDVELDHPRANEMVSLAHASGVHAVVSSHDFETTPDDEALYRLFQREVDAGADIAKVAVMANANGDELRLMSAAHRFSTDHADAVLVAIAMGEIGTVTRIAGEFFGSALTFCSAGEASAPGQLDVATTRRVVAQLHEQGYNSSSIE